MYDYFFIIGHSGWLDNAYSDIPDGIKQLLHVLTFVNMLKKPLLTFWKPKKNRSRKSQEVEEAEEADEASLKLSKSDKDVTVLHFSGA